ncbi:adaptor-related protein complex 3, delta 1 subunit-like garnet [Anticarsia gemmatalis]|uniref:adaptor-related protein complex 3, delta 1 subunit-like garnet n=1 Tax=Anticarsia gemmatalis TaxID=129554 RepID=UPI003F7660BC
MALKKVKGNFERMFDKNLTDLVRGIRNNKDNESKYIAQCMEEIKVELRQDNIAVKANAVAKLTYLQMLGYDISWAIFNIIEVMSSNKFTYKRIGYLAASQSFHADSELLMLTTNMIRKDLNAQNQYEAGLALSGLSCFISHDLARDLANDIMTLMSSTKPYLRMKAVLMMYKVFLRYPEALRPAFPKLKEKLEDPDPGVQSAAVNVVCELARKNPKNYLSLAPVFFKLMTTSTNNWMLIKIIKLFGALTPLEPRLGKKLIEPLTNLIHSTSAMSLLYECINTVIAVLISISSGMPGHASSVQLCVQKLRILIVDSDQNLKYLGLLAMSRILKSHPKSVQAHKDLVLACLDDKDESIRLRALGLLYGMVSKKNLMEIVKKLMVHMERAEGTLYRDELLTRIIEICSQNNYQHVVDFEWYVTVLAELTEMETSAKHGRVVAAQITEVGARVAEVRAFAARECGALVARNARAPPGPASREVLYAAAYVLAEYCREETVMHESISPLLVCAGIGGAHMRARAVCVHAALKLTANLLLKYELDGDRQAAIDVIHLSLGGLRPLLLSEDMEVQERAHNAVALLTLLLRRIAPNDPTLPPLDEAAPAETGVLVQHEQSNGLEKEESEEAVNGENSSPRTFSGGLIEELADLFDGELKPVAPKAQKKVPMPADLNLEQWLSHSRWSTDSSSSEGEAEAAVFAPPPHDPRPTAQFTPEELAMLREARKQEQANNPHYLKDDSPRSYQQEDIPIAEIALEVPLQIHAKRSDKYLMSRESSNKKKKEKRTSKKRKSKKDKPSSDSESEEESSASRPAVAVGGELPEGAALSDDEPAPPRDDPHRALDLDLDQPLREEELLTSRIHQYPSPESGLLDKKSKVSKKTKSGERKSVDKSVKKKKEKKSKQKAEDLMLPELAKPEVAEDFLIDNLTENGKKTIKETVSPDEDIVPAEPTTKVTKTEKHKKSKKDSKDKESKKNKSSKKGKHETKTGYEEALGISTPSKEVI